VITGFNTDIPFEGVTYHVQTEDKGLKTPLILSLVYVGGTIIASKRTPYADLVESGFDEGTLTERLQRQHKLICAAIRAGRVDDLKKMSGPPTAEPGPSPNGARKKSEKKKEAERKEAAKAEAAKTEAAKAAKAEATRTEAAEASETEAAPAAETVAPEPVAEEVVTEPVEVAALEQAEEWVEAVPVEILEADAEEELYLTLLEDEGEFRAGQLATIKVQVGHGAYGQRPAPDASVIIKVLGTSFRPLILSTRTDHDGVAVVRALLPRFTSGRAAVIIRAASGANVAELRRIIHQY
jgi:hypothetical protein